MVEGDEGIREAVRLEHRLTKIEQAIVSSTEAIEVMGAHVSKQNGRVSGLETRESRRDGIYAAIFAAAPFVFWALNKWA